MVAPCFAKKRSVCHIKPSFWRRTLKTSLAQTLRFGSVPFFLVNERSEARQCNCRFVQTTEIFFAFCQMLPAGHRSAAVRLYIQKRHLSKISLLVSFWKKVLVSFAARKCHTACVCCPLLYDSWQSNVVNLSASITSLAQYGTELLAWTTPNRRLYPKAIDDRKPFLFYCWSWINIGRLSHGKKFIVNLNIQIIIIIRH